MRGFLQDVRGSAAIEYTLLISLIGLVLGFTLHALGANLVDVFSLLDGGLTPIQVIDDPNSSNL